MKMRFKLLSAFAFTSLMGLAILAAPEIGNTIGLMGQTQTYKLTLDANQKYTSAEQSANTFTRKTALGSDVAFITSNVNSRSESQYFCQIAPGTGENWLRNKDAINGIISITITHDLKLDNGKYDVLGGYSYGEYHETLQYRPGIKQSDYTTRFEFAKPVNFFSIQNMYADAGTYIRTMTVEYSCVQAAPEQKVRNPYSVTESGGIASSASTFKPFGSDDWVGKYFYMEFKYDGGNTRSSYVPFSLINQASGGWQNISGELDIFGNMTANKDGVISPAGDGWYSVAFPSVMFNGDGNDKSSMNLIYFSTPQGVNELTVDLNSISFVDIEHEYVSGNDKFVKFDTPLKNWKGSKNKLVIDFEPTEAAPSGTKEVMSMVTSSGTKVATFTLRVKTHRLQQGDNGTEIPGAVIQKSGNIWEATIDFSVIDPLSGYDGSETIAAISFDRIWCNFKTYSIDYVVRPEYEKTNEVTMKGDSLKVINLTDVHVNSTSALNEGTLLRKTIEYAIAEARPDMITFSGDFVHVSNKIVLTNLLCKFMDGFKIPYFLIFGNHDREGSTAEAIAEVIAKSKYGYIDLGPSSLESEGNYTVKIKNSSGNVVHGFIMMDTGDKIPADPSNIVYANNPVSGVHYGSYNGKKTYCEGQSWDHIKGPQVPWYEEQAASFDCETSLICHAPLVQYPMAFENYMRAKNTNNTAALAACAPMGKCTQGEACCGSLGDYGLFDSIKRVNSTKNVICGHDHVNDFSLVYEGVRLTYSLKVADNAYWGGGSQSGYTEININAAGNASVNHVYYNPTI